ncbi:hypothetical protein [Noviherbaspirillum massiliense]|uniref:hypothetical protein n=1 Tax=Noviherbaspirillum massiliense TaxID=1465823 RepID=UPI0002E558B7|nr:hypothetical protein [Noviherbaspirillum massiliense]
MESTSKERRYGVGGDNGTIPENKRCCVQPIIQTGRATLVTLQCNRPRGHGPNGLYCETHARSRGSKA